MRRREQGVLLLLLSDIVGVIRPFVMVAADVAPLVNAFFRALFAVPALLLIGVLGARHGGDDFALEWPHRRWVALLIWVYTHLWGNRKRMPHSAPILVIW
jgi:hypothetical protein